MWVLISKMIISLLRLLTWSNIADFINVHVLFNIEIIKTELKAQSFEVEYLNSKHYSKSNDVLISSALNESRVVFMCYSFFYK